MTLMRIVFCRDFVVIHFYGVLLLLEERGDGLTISTEEEDDEVDEDQHWSRGES